MNQAKVSDKSCFCQLSGYNRALVKKTRNMSANQSHPLSVFHNTVVNTYHIYNSLFLQLPFNDVYATGVLLPILRKACKKGYQQGNSQTPIISRGVRSQ